MTVQLSWVPVRRGAIYCSPGCGAKCTYAAYQKAKLQAKTLADKLGRGYVPVVWENMGWHARVDLASGFLCVYPPKDQSEQFSAFLSRAAEHAEGAWVAKAPTPVNAVREVLKLARRDSESLSRFLAQVFHAQTEA